jgi:hypothetical protein
MLPKIASLRQAKAIVERAVVHPIAGFDEHGNVAFNGDRYGHLYAYKMNDGTWIITHYVSCGIYGKGASRKEALLDFIEQNPKIKEYVIGLKKWRKKAAAIVEKYSLL